MTLQPSKLLAAALGLLIVLPSSLPAEGLQTVRIPDLPFISKPIVIDGELGDWTGVEGVTYQPFDVSLAGSQNPEVRALQEKPSVAKVLFAYDTEAVYCAVDWKGSHPAANPTAATSDGAASWWKNGDGIELHVSTDQTVHIASWPLADGTAATMERLDDQTTWTTAQSAGITSAIKAKADQTGYTEEIRIPWSVLSRAAKIPATGKMRLACDVVWKDIDAKFVEQLSPDVGAASHLSENFFTSPARFYTHTALFTPNTWGELTFGTDPHPPQVTSSPLGTGIAAWTIPATATPPTITGNLVGWSAPFADITIEPALIGTRYGGKISLQYDAGNLYVAAHFSTAGALRNVMPESTREGYNGGDALQIRIQDKTTVSLCGWYDSSAGKPALTADGGDLAKDSLLQQGAQEAFAKDADGKGYTQEIAVPWKLLFPGEAAPRGGDKWRLTFQPWWSGIDPRCTFVGTATLGKVGAFAVNYDLPADGEVTLGLFDKDNHLVRTILKGEYRNKGPLTEHWDGLDQWGQPITPGSYLAKGIYHPPISTDYVMSFGNPGNPPWPTPDGKGDWLSDEEASQGAATDGKWVYLAAPGSEKGYSIMAVDGTGQRQWGMQAGYYPRAVSLAVDGDHLYALYSGPEITDTHTRRYDGIHADGRAILLSMDKHTGAPTQFSLRNPRLKIATWPHKENAFGLWDLRNSKGFTPDVYSGQPRYYTNSLGEETNAVGLAAANGFLYVALHDENKILVIKADTAEKIDEIPVPKPAGLYAMPDHSLLAVSGKEVVRISLPSKQVQTIISGGLLAPRCVTADRRGRMYVSDWGASFQVKIFSPNGSLLGLVGKEGGRPWIGKWDPTGMILPTGLAVTDDDKLWVAEDDAAPKRISVWNPETGALVKEYLGPPPYGGGGSVIDPKDPTNVYALGLQMKVDYAAKTWKPVSTIDRRMDLAQPFARDGNGSYDARIVYHGGHEYMISQGDQRIVVSERKGDLFVPVAAMGGSERGGRTIDGTQWTIWDSDLGYHRIENYFPPFFKGHAGDNYTWVDSNNDGLVQENEMRWYKTAGRGDPLDGGQPEAFAGWGFSIADDWSIFWSGFCKDTGAVYRLDLKGWTPAGAPIYDIKDSKPIVLRDRAWTPSSVFAGSDGNVLVNYGYEYSPPKNTIECFDREGKPLWGLALVKQQGPKDIQVDSVLKELAAPGIGGVYAGWLWHGNYLPYLFTADGLYVCSLLEIGRLGPKAAWDESYKSYYQDAKGVPYIINGANDNYHLLKINGLEGGRFEAPVTITKADTDRAATLRELPTDKPAPPPVIKLAWNGEPPKIDGNLKDWDLGAGVTLKGDKGRTAQIALARDASNLYLAYEVSKESPLVNKGTDWQTLFTSGDCVDLMLGTDAKANPHRPGAVQGDERLLIGLYQGKPTAVLYRPVVPGTPNPTRLMAAQIDQISQLPSARIAYQTKGNTYTIEASIPLQDLGIDPKETGTLRGDVGVIFADETGSSRSQRLYYYNKKTNITADLTTEATLQPGEWGDIVFPIGKNLLKNSSFEEDFAPTVVEGWCPVSEKNGARAVIDADSPHSGHQALLLEQVNPVIFPSDAVAATDFKVFTKAANNGAGGGSVEVEEVVPVVGGHFYTFRVRYRTDHMRREKQQPGPQRGYSRFAVDLYWMTDTPAKARLGNVRVIDERRDCQEWQQATNTIVNHWSVNRPFQAPAGATSATIELSMNTMAPDDLPKVYIDDLELVETPSTVSVPVSE